jgi:hypothetical protein
MGKVELRNRALEYYEGMFRISKALPTEDSRVEAAVGEDFNLKKHPSAFFRASRATSRSLSFRFGDELFAGYCLRS